MRHIQALSNAYNLGDKWLEREFRHVNSMIGKALV